MRIQTIALRGTEDRKPTWAHPPNLTRRLGPATMLLIGVLMNSHSAFAESPKRQAAKAFWGALCTPTAHCLSVVPIVVGSFIYAFAREDLKRDLGRIIVALGITTMTINLLVFILTEIE